MVSPANRPPPASALSLPYRIFRAFFRFLTSIWFREVNVVDDEFISDEAGALFISWHPNGLIDPMLMTAKLPQRVTTLVSHRLFKLPLVSLPFRAAGVVPLTAAAMPFSRRTSSEISSDVLSAAATTLANGGSVLMFPEEKTHAEASVQSIRSGAARLLLEAVRKAQEQGLPPPRLVPVGLHYSDSHRFRERAAIVLERNMVFPNPPEEPDEGADKAWVTDLTSAIGVELQRANLAKSTWRERMLIWKARSMVQAEKQRQSGEELRPLSYAESVLGARRLRAGWEYLAVHDAAAAGELVQDCEAHFDELERRNLRPHDVDSRPEKLTFSGFFRILISWLWSVAWMFGLVTWGAILGNYVPYKFQSLLEKITRRANVDDSLQGSIKVLSSVLVFPIWWLALTTTFVWLLLDPNSPVSVAMASHEVLQYVTMLPAVGAFVFFMLFWPLTARAHMKLYARFVRSTRRLRQWRSWQDVEHQWGQLSATQGRLAERLVALGAGLVLPGDPDWEDPPLGKDDAAVVRQRSTAEVAERSIGNFAQGFE